MKPNRNMLRAVSHRGFLGAALAMAAAAAWLAPNPAFAQVRFNDMVGVNFAEKPAMVYGVDLLLGDVITHNNTMILWGNVQRVDPDTTHGEGSNGEDFGILWSRSNQLAEMRREYGVDTFIDIGYTPSWATRTADVGPFEFGGRTIYLTKEKYDTPQPDGDEYYMLHAEYDNANKDTLLWQRAYDIDTSKLPPDDEHMEDYRQWVDRVVHVTGSAFTDTGISPGTQYYQIWNEAFPGGPYWASSMEEYFQRVHKPAAEVIRAAPEGGGNKKVVYGAWVSPALIKGPPLDLPRMLDQYNAWDSIDVLDVHYQTLEQLEQLRLDAAERGYEDKGIWMSEWAAYPIANSPYLRDPGSVANFYFRYACWALEHNPEKKPHRFRVDFYRYYDKDGNSYDSTGNGSNSPVLVMGPHDAPELTVHGRALKAVDTLLDGGPITVYENVTTDTGLMFELDEQVDSIEALRVDEENGDRIVVAVHLNDDSGGTIEILLPELALGQVASAERVTPWGDHMELDAEANPEGEGVMFAVPTAFTGPNGETWTSWDQYSNLPRTFFVNVQLDPTPIPEPGTMTLLGLGGLMLLSRTRRRQGNHE